MIRKCKQQKKEYLTDYTAGFLLDRKLNPILLHRPKLLLVC